MLIPIGVLSEMKYVLSGKPMRDLAKIFIDFGDILVFNSQSRFHCIFLLTTKDVSAKFALSLYILNFSQDCHLTVSTFSNSSHTLEF